MNSKKLIVLIGSLTVLIAVIATLSVADDPRESVTTAVSEPARSLDVAAPDTLRPSQLAESEAAIPDMCCCQDGCRGVVPACPNGCVLSPFCIICPILGDENGEEVEVTWSDSGDESDL